LDLLYAVLFEGTKIMKINRRMYC